MYPQNQTNSFVNKLPLYIYILVIVDKTSLCMNSFSSKPLLIAIIKMHTHKQWKIIQSANASTEFTWRKKVAPLLTCQVSHILYQSLIHCERERGSMWTAVASTTKGNSNPNFTEGKHQINQSLTLRVLSCTKYTSSHAGKFWPQCAYLFIFSNFLCWVVPKTSSSSNSRAPAYSNAILGAAGSAKKWLSQLRSLAAIASRALKWRKEKAETNQECSARCERNPQYQCLSQHLHQCFPRRLNHQLRPPLGGKVGEERKCWLHSKQDRKGTESLTHSQHPPHNNLSSFNKKKSKSYLYCQPNKDSLLCCLSVCTCTLANILMHQCAFPEKNVLQEAARSDTIHLARYR